MARPVMNEAVDEEDFNRMDKGLPLRPKAPAPVKEADPLQVEGEIKFKDIPVKELSAVEYTRKTKRGKDNCVHVGYDVTVTLKDKDPLIGWMGEGELINLRRRVPKTVEMVEA